MSHLSGNSHSRGFTLLEVMVALSVFAVVSLLTWRGLDSMATTKARLDQEMRMWRELELVFERISLDLTQLAPRFWLDPQGKPRSALQLANTESGTHCQLDVLRFGGDREPIHVRYALHEGRFTLAILTDIPGVQSAPRAAEEPVAHLLLDKVERCELAALEHDNAWQARWPVDDPDNPGRPRGIRLRLTLSERGLFERIFYLP